MHLKISLALLVLTPTVALALSPEEADALASAVGRPLAAVVPSADLPGEMRAPGEPPLPIFLNGLGGRYTCGNSNDSSINRSTIACHSSPADVGGWPGTANQWVEFVECMQSMFAPFNVVVTDVEPAAGDYVEAVVGGSPGQIGMGSGVGGVSPFICGVIERSIAFTFADVYNENSPRFAQSVCETTAQEVAHSFGLEHEMNCADPMTYLSNCGNQTFQDEFSSCGEFEPQQCSCGGAQQNSFQQLMDELGPRADDLAPPTAALVAPADGSSHDSDEAIVIEADVADDIGAVVTLEWDYAGEAWACPGEGGAWTCTRAGTRHTWTIDVGDGARTFRVRARDFAGNEVVTDDRAVWLSPDGTGPPVDDGPPSIALGSPLAGAVRSSDDVLRIVASVVDDNAGVNVELAWPFTNKIFACPSTTDTVSCTVDGSTYTWELDVGEGDRTFTIRARDVVGNIATSGPVTISLVAGAPAAIDDDREDDDTFASSRPVACGETLALVAADADWLALTVPDSERATVTTTPALALTARTGPLPADVLASGDGTVEVGADADVGAVLVEVRPANAAAGPYLLEVLCAPRPVSGGEDDPGEDGPDDGPDDGPGADAGAGDVDGAPPNGQPLPNDGAPSCGAAGTSWIFALLAMVFRRRACVVTSFTT